MIRSLKITAVCAAACGVLAAPALAQEPNPNDPAVVETAQSKPVKIKHGPPHSVVGQAAITSEGELIVRLAVPNEPGVDGEDVIAETPSKVIDDEFNGDVTKAHLSIRLKSNRTGTVSVIGPDNSTSPDSAVYKLRWSIGKPSIRIVGVGT